MVGICIPTYEHPEQIIRAIDSIKSQLYRNYVVFISDDSKTNEVEKCLEQYSDMNIIYSHNVSPLGTSENVNNAINKAISYGVTLIKLLFKDDWFADENALGTMVEVFDDKKIDIVFTANYEKYSDKEEIHCCESKIIESVNNSPGVLFMGNYLGAPSNVIYRTCDVMFDKQFTWLLDVDFYLRLMPGKNMKYIDEPLINIGHDGYQLTDYYMNNPQEMINENKRLYKKYEWLHTKKMFIFLCKYIIKQNIIRMFKLL